jgi:hypothetical protein
MLHAFYLRVITTLFAETGVWFGGSFMPFMHSRGAEPRIAASSCRMRTEMSRVVPLLALGTPLGPVDSIHPRVHGKSAVCRSVPCYVPAVDV